MALIIFEASGPRDRCVPRQGDTSAVGIASAEKQIGHRQVQRRARLYGKNLVDQGPSPLLASLLVYRYSDFFVTAFTSFATEE